MALNYYVLGRKIWILPAIQLLKSRDEKNMQVLKRQWRSKWDTQSEWYCFDHTIDNERGMSRHCKLKAQCVWLAAPESMKASCKQCEPLLSSTWSHVFVIPAVAVVEPAMCGNVCKYSAKRYKIPLNACRNRKVRSSWSHQSAAVHLYSFQLLEKVRVHHRKLSWPQPPQFIYTAQCLLAGNHLLMHCTLVTVYFFKRAWLAKQISRV